MKKFFSKFLSRFRIGRNRSTILDHQYAPVIILLAYKAKLCGWCGNIEKAFRTPLCPGGLGDAQLDNSNLQGVSIVSRGETREMLRFFLNELGVYEFSSVDLDELIKYWRVQ